jgi:hypothetical protein
MSSAATLSSPRSRRSDDLSPSTVRLTAPSLQELRPAASKSPATIVIVVSTRADEQEQVTQNLLKQGYRLRTEGSPDGDDAAPALRNVYASLGGRFGGEARLSAVLVQSETGPAPSPTRDVLAFAGLRLDRRRREVRVAGSLVELTKTEFDVLFCQLATQARGAFRATANQPRRGISLRRSQQPLNRKPIRLRNES